MHQNRFTRRKERQLWLMLLTIAMTSNVFLLLFLQSPWVPPGPPSLDYSPPRDLHKPVPRLPRDFHTRRLAPPHRVPQPVEVVHEEFPQDATTQAEPYQDEAANRATPGPPPPRKLVETVGEESVQGTTKRAEKIVRTTTKQPPKPRRPIPNPRPKQPKSSNTENKETTVRLPWLENPKNVPRLEQVIQSLQTLPDEDEPEWKQSSYFEPRSKIVTALRPEVLVDSVECPSHGPYLLVVIPSVGVSVKARQAIRGTWASPLYGEPWPGDNRNFNSLVKVVFFLGVKSPGKSPTLEEEARKFRDIVQMDFQESYRNLSLKMALAVEWSATYCSGADHVMKVDEDTFVDLPLLLDVLQRASEGLPPRFVLGYHHFKEQPTVLRVGKWGASKVVYPFQHFPRHLYGHSYVLSSEAAKAMTAAWRYMPMVPNEDALLTGILAKVAQVTRVHCDWFAREELPGMPLPPTKEMARGRSVSQTGFKPLQKLYDMWDMVFDAYDNMTAKEEET